MIIVRAIPERSVQVSHKSPCSIVNRMAPPATGEGQLSTSGIGRGDSPLCNLPDLTPGQAPPAPWTATGGAAAMAEVSEGEGAVIRVSGPAAFSPYPARFGR